MNASHTTIATLAAPNDWRELASRDNDGIEVSLLWSKRADRVKVTVTDSKLDVEFELNVASADALTAFYHPFGYVGSQTEAELPSHLEREAA